MRQRIKRAVDLCCAIAVSPAAAMCALEAALSKEGDVFFIFWAPDVALLAGPAGRVAASCVLSSDARSVC